MPTRNCSPPTPLSSRSFPLDPISRFSRAEDQGVERESRLQQRRLAQAPDGCLRCTLLRAFTKGFAVAFRLACPIRKGVRWSVPICASDPQGMRGGVLSWMIGWKVQGAVVVAGCSKKERPAEAGLSLFVSAELIRQRGKRRTSRRCSRRCCTDQGRSARWKPGHR